MTHLDHMDIDCLYKILSSLARKGDGEGGILFDNEDEKEQWEEDQKVSVVLDAVNLMVVMCLFCFNIPNCAGSV